MSALNLAASLRQRLGVILAVGMISVICCFGGAFTSFFAAPKQRIDASQIARSPTLSTAELDAAAVGERVIVSGTLVDNLPASNDGDFVAYEMEEWKTTLIEDSESGSYRIGRWDSENRVRVIPALTIAIDGGTVTTHPNDSVQLGGNLHEEIFESDNPDSDRSNNRPDGSRHYEGLRNGEIVTVIGAKASDGGIVPDQIFVGDRVAFDQVNREQATGLFQMGLCLMGLAPLIFVGGVLFALFKR